MIILAKPEHAFALVLRPEDAKDIGDAAMLARAIDRSVEAWTWVHNGKPAALFGVMVASFTSNQGYLWMSGSETVCAAPRAFFRESVAQIAAFRTRYPELAAHCDRDWPASLRWLKRLGFAIGDPDLSLDPSGRFLAATLR